MAVRKEEWGWIVDFTYAHADGRRERVRRKSPVQTRRGAEEYERQLRNELLNPTPVAKEVPTLAAFAEEFMSGYVVAAGNKPAEVRNKRVAINNHLAPKMGKKRLDTIDTRLIDGYIAAKLAEGLSPKTVRNHVSVLHRMLTLAQEYELIGAVPHFRWPKVSRSKFDFLDFDEARRLVQGADEEIWRTMILVGLRTGLRQGELLALHWDDIDLLTGRILVRHNTCPVTKKISTPKSGRNREVGLSEEAKAALKAHRHLRGPLVFCAEDGSALVWSVCRRPLERACRRAGLRKVTWHVLRHTFASHLVMRGVPLKVVQELLGHATIEMTMRYAHLSPNVSRDAVQLLDGEEDSRGHGSSVAVRTLRTANSAKPQV